MDPSRRNTYFQLFFLLSALQITGCASVGSSGDAGEHVAHRINWQKETPYNLTSLVQEAHQSHTDVRSLMLQTEQIAEARRHTESRELLAAIEKAEREARKRKREDDARRKAILQKQRAAERARRQRADVLAQKAEQARQVEARKNPAIEVLDPPIFLHEGRQHVVLDSARAAQEIVGNVKADRSIKSLRINGDVVAVDEFNLFFVTVPLNEVTTDVEVTVVHEDGLHVDYNFSISQPGHVARLQLDQ